MKEKNPSEKPEIMKLNAAMRPSDTALDFIKGFESERLFVYDDGYGYLTCGIGHRVLPGDNLKKGDQITKEMSENFFARDVERAAEPIRRLVSVVLTQGQFDALVSFVFNVGWRAFAQSSLLAQLNRGNYAAAREKLDDWVYASGRKSAGLARRRNAEQTLWNS